MDKSSNKGSFFRFLKQNLALVIIVTCAIAICVIVLVLNTANQPNSTPVDATPDNGTGIVDVPTPTEPTSPAEKSYVKPIAQYTLGMGYSRDAEYVLVFKKTLNEYSVHNGIDFLAEAGTAVCAVFDGTVSRVYNDFGMGQTVEITHEDGYVSRYCSLGEDICVSEGQTVEAGEKIGTVGNTATYENLEGNHLHFELLKDGQYVNPNTKIEDI